MRRKTSLSIDSELWAQFQIAVVKKYGHTRKLSDAVEEALKLWLKND